MPIRKQIIAMQRTRFKDNKRKDWRLRSQSVHCHQRIKCNIELDISQKGRKIFMINVLTNVVFFFNFKCTPEISVTAGRASSGQNNGACE
ncbi:hypothetical protein NPIL_326681 [Nephila pilipes]|uniref:Uncharacterized protein n=1 Tax=Nephila pilipes TaxID=299642 RepID=A0A8X6TAH1_NEPPI|nr:hypothetical protein NPIL_326681 [Nephila pilipes]